MESTTTERLMSVRTKVHSVLLIPLQQPKQKIAQLWGRLPRDAG